MASKVRPIPQTASPPNVGLWGGIVAAVGLGLVVALLPPPLMLAAAAVVVLALGLISGVHAALVWALTLVPLRAMLLARAPGLIPLDLVLIVLALCAGAWLIQRTARRQPLLRLHYSPPLLAVGIFMASGALSLWGAQSVNLWLSEWSKWVFIFALVLLILQLRRWEWVAFALACAGVANAVLGFYVYFGGSGVTHFAINAQNFRAFGTFEQPNPFGGFMGILTPFLGALAVGYLVRGWQVFRLERRLAWRIGLQASFFGLAAVFTSGALVFSWSRGAWLALAAALMVTAITLPRRIGYGLAILGLLAVAGGALWASGRLPASITDRVVSSFSDLLSADDVRGVNVTPENYAAIERFAHWQAAVEMANRAPWLGVGLGNYEVAYPSVRLLGWDLALGHAHNYYLNVLGEAGIIGFSSYLAMWFIIVFITWRARRHPDPLSSAAAAGLLGSWIYIAFHSLTDHLYVNAVFLHVGVLIGIAALLHRQTWVPHRLKA